MVTVELVAITVLLPSGNISAVKVSSDSTIKSCCIGKVNVAALLLT